MGARILVVRLGAMGDILHTLPAVATLKHSFPSSRLVWVVEAKWVALLEDNPFVDEVIVIDRRRLGALLGTWRRLRAERFDWAVDFQGLFKSAAVATLARPDRIYGFHQSQVRERVAALFYSRRVRVRAEHIVDRNLELAAATGASGIIRVFPMPEGKPEGLLPTGDYILACPLAGWAGKQWPLDYYTVLASRLMREWRLPLVLNGPSQARPLLSKVEGAWPHVSGIPGLIHAMRRALAVVGVDSGPLHLAAALEKPGVAIFGPTDPRRNGPYGGTITVLRSPNALTTFKRSGATDPCMKDITPNEVFEALRESVGLRGRPTGASH